MKSIQSKNIKKQELIEDIGEIKRRRYQEKNAISFDEYLKKKELGKI